MSEGVEEEGVPVIYLTCLCALHASWLLGGLRRSFQLYSAIARGQKIQVPLVFYFD